MSTEHDTDLIDHAAETLARICIARLDRKAGEHYRRGSEAKAIGDALAAKGKTEHAARHHATTATEWQAAATAEAQATALAEAFELPLPDVMANTRWAPNTAHRGVGEGDEVIPEPHPAPGNSEKSIPTPAEYIPGRDLDHIPLEDMTDAEIAHVQHGFEQSLGWMLTMPEPSGHVCAVEPENGPERRFSTQCTPAQIWRVMSDAEAARLASPSKLETTDLNPQ